MVFAGAGPLEPSSSGDLIPASMDPTTLGGEHPLVLSAPSLGGVDYPLRGPLGSPPPTPTH